MARNRNPGAVFAAVALLPVVAAVGALIAMVLGAAAGWIGGLIFPQVFDRLSTLLFGEVAPAWQIGAMFGFIAGFLRASAPRRR
ncbi:hypothetical protein WJS89_02920 [Sphingomicrobium sp. XHP0235]|uniref:hypothetical protein n=1 Tax=Sphingomicrobium aquimarinum TaxID=3133971 RepID=UPI0031FEA37F